jgi:hypothetical protein
VKYSRETEAINFSDWQMRRQGCGHGTFTRKAGVDGDDAEVGGQMSF